MKQDPNSPEVILDRRLADLETDLFETKRRITRLEEYTTTLRGTKSPRGHAALLRSVTEDAPGPLSQHLVRLPEPRRLRESDLNDPLLRHMVGTALRLPPGRDLHQTITDVLITIMRWQNEAPPVEDTDFNIEVLPLIQYSVDYTVSRRSSGEGSEIEPEDFEESGVWEADDET